MAFWRKQKTRGWLYQFAALLLVAACIAWLADNTLENMLLSSLNQAQQSSKVALDSFPVDPNILTQLQTNMPVIKEHMKAQGCEPILLVTPQLRPLLARYARLFAPGLHVLSYNEVPDESELNIVGSLA